ncbi:MAG: polymerase, sigma-24 subunit, subfamily [Candidatus Parcubacteria bacterium]|nr:polymerase, sigma-24 subunit, subfamily [Candidatus Parcubacteria bacterium]
MSTTHTEKAETSRPSAEIECEIDSKLIKRFVVDQDESAFIEIWERYNKYIWKLAFNYLYSKEDADEIVQDTFIRAHRSLTDFRSESCLKTWLFKIARNKCTHRYYYNRRRRKRDHHSLDTPLGADTARTLADLLPDENADPYQAAVRFETENMAGRFMSKLPDHQHMLLVLTLDNVPYDAIASQLATNSGTVKSRVSRARSCLRQKILEECPEIGTFKSSLEYTHRR